MADVTDRPSGLEAIADGSRAVALLRRGVRAGRNSRLVRGLQWLATVGRQSFVVRWLTAEPDPEVIVIDLRETYTVGPIVAMLDRIVDWLSPAWRESGLRTIADGLVSTFEAAGRTKAGRAVRKLLEPPEPPDGSVAPDDEE